MTVSPDIAFVSCLEAIGDHVLPEKGREGAVPCVVDADTADEIIEAEGVGDGFEDVRELEGLMFFVGVVGDMGGGESIFMVPCCDYIH